jgi:hypothetical protein
VHVSTPDDDETCMAGRLYLGNYVDELRLGVMVGSRQAGWLAGWPPAGHSSRPPMLPSIMQQKAT